MNAHATFAPTTSLANILAREAARRFNAARTLADRIDAIDFGRDQQREADDRADLITERVMPRKRAINGFDDPHGFMAGARFNYERGELRAMIRERLLEKIVERDGLFDGYFRNPAPAERATVGGRV